MLAICIEASHMRGMGHLFRALNFISYLKEKEEPFLVLVNADSASLNILDENNITYEVVDYADEESNWEKKLIEKYQISIWLNDKFESSYALCQHIKECGVLLAVIDDRGEGAALADIYFAGMIFDKTAEELPGKKVYLGLEYNILNPEIRLYKRQRKQLGKVLVTLGGSDTYGATILAVKALKSHGYAADIVVGANFQHTKELEELIDINYKVYHTVPSLMEMFSHYDLAITGGGVTPLEANAAGLPCVIIANEPHEVVIGQFLEKCGGAVFAGYYRDLDETKFDLEKLDIEKLSLRAMNAVPLTGTEHIYEILFR